MKLFPKIVILSDDKIQAIKKIYYPKENFEKFTNSNHPEYESYKDRKEEMATDNGSNNAVEQVLGILLDKDCSEIYYELNK